MLPPCHVCVLRRRRSVDVAQLQVHVGQEAVEDLWVEDVQHEQAGCQDLEGDTRSAENSRESFGTRLLSMQSGNSETEADDTCLSN